MTVAVVTEKPSVARDIAAVLGARTRGDGCLRGNGYVVTWAIGHLVVLAEPRECNPRWKDWRLADLPMIPAEWRLAVAEPTRDQFANVKRVLNDDDIDEVVCATDAGREGELIFRYIYEAARCKKKVRRLWISSLTADAIAKGFRDLRDGHDYDALGRAARARSRADWLVGMNLSRAYSLVHDANFSVGRVQTPTLAMVVARELEIRGFVPEDYFEVLATLRPRGQGDTSAARPQHGRHLEGTYLGTWFRGETRRLPSDGEEASRIALRVRSGEARIESVEKKQHSIPPPLLYDLTELQRHANRLFGMSAQRTLDVAQSLYERKKLLSYPRTDSRKLSRSVAETLPAVVRTIEGGYRGRLAPGTGERRLGSRFVDDAGITDHHAIIPTEARAGADLQGDERRIYDLVCRRLLAAWHEDHVYASTKVVTRVISSDVDRFASSGTSVERPGWKVLDVGHDGDKGNLGVPMVPGGLREGDPQDVVDAKPIKKQTRPPARLTDATLLTAMETGGRAVLERAVLEKEVADAMREHGLGTPATRAAIIEVLLKREYVVRDAKSLVATEKGIALIALVHANVKTPAMTGEWEAKLARIERGTGDFDAFMQGIAEYVREVVASVGAGTAATKCRGARETPSSLAAPAAVTRQPSPRATSPAALESMLHEKFGFASYRPYQEEVCLAATLGRDVLLVMPTGAGKSLCYQLPGLARGGTTLVVSPLIALMEDQVAKLLRHGLSADRIHSGRDREASRAACRAYLDGRLDFLFIAPERLKIRGFPEMLARRPPTLVAIDEAHCISQWGHDFRPEYRMLGERLPLLRPAPVIALTATATPSVQEDIVAQLRLTSAVRFIHGFRRTNIAVEVVEKGPSDRTRTVSSLLSDPARRPAIVYAPTRRDAEALAGELSTSIRAVAYHAGMTSAERAEAQRSFLDGAVEVVVATVAFGMGIDKPNVRTVVHAALPATVEGYYQEIGRAGRDGHPSRAVLLHSFVDGKTHEFFHKRDYPPVDSLKAIFEKLGTKPIAKDALVGYAGLPPEDFEKALEKLWLHGGAIVDDGDSLRRGSARFAASYERQSAHRLAQIDAMRRYAAKSACRMLQLVAHFGDAKDAGTPCGLCDVCAPEACVALSHREPSAAERDVARRVLHAIRERDGITVGQLHRDVFPRGDVDRATIEHVLGGLVRAASVRLRDDSFVKDDGAVVHFQRAHLRGALPAALDEPRFAVTRGEVAGKNGTRKKPKGGPKRARPADADDASGGPSALASALRAWRLSEAKKARVPAFRIMGDRTLMAIAADAPSDEATLGRVRGVTARVARRHGTVLLAIVARHTRAGRP